MAILSGRCAGAKGPTNENNGMANALEQNLRQWGRRLRTGPAGNFFRWWIAELGDALPDAWQEKLRQALRRVVLVPGDNSLAVGVDENRRVRLLETLSGAPDQSVQRQQVDDLLHRQDLHEAPRFLLLESAVVLSREFNLPLAAEANLQQVIGFEMDRQTPFRAADVYFDYVVRERNAAAGQLRTEVWLVPRVEADRAVRALGQGGFALSGIDVREGDRTLGLNLLPGDQRVRTVNRRSRLNLALGAAAVLLLALVMWQSLALRQHQISELEAAIEEVQGEARKVSVIRRQIEDASEAAGFLATRRGATPLAVEVLADVTRILPDDTHLDRLVINATDVQMQGKSRNAQQLIELVNASGLFEAAAFRGSTRLDARSGLEIFEVNATIVPKGGGG
jgi:general secretion pathway protein L